MHLNESACRKSGQLGLEQVQVVRSPISNDCLKVMFYDQTEPKLVPKCLLQVSVRELHNSLVSDPNYGGLKDARDEDGRIIISDSTLRSLLPPQLKQMSARYKIICDCECCISDKVFIHHCYPGVIGI